MDFETTSKHCPICDADVDIPADLFGGMSQMAKIIARAFREPHDTQSRDGPDGSRDWTPAEIVAHLADVEVSLGLRIRRVLSEEKPELQVYNQETWAKALAYGERDLATSLAAYGANRQLNLEILRRAGDAGLDRAYRHAEFGEHPLRILVEHIADHDIAHLRQIRGE